MGEEVRVRKRPRSSLKCSYFLLFCAAPVPQKKMTLRKNPKQRERRRSFVGGFSRASVSVCVCSFKGVQRVVQLSKRDVFSLSPPGRYFWLPRLINQSVATKPNCNQHQNARRVLARWKGDNNNLVAQEWRRGFGRRRTLIRKQRCVCRIRRARIF